jgi:hypothetical protein
MRDGDMTPRMMVLGLVAVQAGTVADAQRRLVDLFPGADFPKNAAHTNLPVLASKGYVRLAEGSELSQIRYEATGKGIAYLSEWVASSPPLPAIRDPIHGRVEFAGLYDIANLKDLESLLLCVRTQEKGCQAVSNDAHDKLMAEQRLTARFPPKIWQERLSADLRLLRLKDVKLSWSDQEARRKAFGDELEEILMRYARQER